MSQITHGKVIIDNTIEVDKKLDIYNHVTDIENNKSIVNREFLSKLKLALSDDNLDLLLDSIYLSGVDISSIISSYLNNNPSVICDFDCNIGSVYIDISVNEPLYGIAVGAGSYAIGSPVVLTAMPSPMKKFNGWYKDGNLVSTSMVYIFTATENVTYNAVFSALYSVVTISNPIDGGTTLVDGQTIKMFEYGQTATITASPSPDYDFIEWSNNMGNSPTLSVSVTGNAEYIATYERDEILIDGMVQKTFFIPVSESIESFIISSDENWNILSSPSWITISPSSSNKGDNNVTATISENTGSSDRTGEVIFKLTTNQNITCKAIFYQDSLDDNVLTINSKSSESINSVYTSSIQNVTLQSSQNWGHYSDSNWVTVNPISGTGTSGQTVSLNISENPTTSVRVAIVTFYLTFFQDVTATVIVTQDPATPYIYINGKTTETLSMPSSNASGSVTISSNSSWRIDTLPSWISITPSSSSYASTIANITVQNNTTTSSRSHTVSFYISTNPSIKATLTITQGSNLINNAIHANKQNYDRTPTLWRGSAVAVSQYPVDSRVEVYLCGYSSVGSGCTTVIIERGRSQSNESNIIEVQCASTEDEPTIQTISTTPSSDTKYRYTTDR